MSIFFTIQEFLLHPRRK